MHSQDQSEIRLPPL